MENNYHVIFQDKFKKQLRKLNPSVSKRITKWLYDNIDGTLNPCQYGKALVGNYKGCWRYRVGTYRIIALVKDHELIILCLTVAHRKEIY